jgi:predicted NBD/HSP70 family sugar kinase
VSEGGPATLTPLARTLLRLVWQEREISRAELSRRLALSRSTVSELVPRLLATSLVVEAGAGVSSGGRRPIQLRFDDEAFHILGVDLGATHVGVVVMDLRGTVRAACEREHAVQADPVGTRALIDRMCREALVAARVDPARLLGMGAGLPSPVAPQHPERLHRLTLPAWGGEHRLGEIAAGLGVPGLFENDANLGALAEWWWGAARGIDDFTYLHVATGVGAGHVVAGRLYRGAGGVAGEAGHLSIDPHGPLCNCGNRGCLWTYVGSPNLLARVQALAAEYPGSALATGTPTVAALERAALADDPLAVRALAEAGEHLGVAIVNIVNLLNPTRVIIGGSLGRLGERLLAPVRAAVATRIFESTATLGGLHATELGEHNVAIGAATLVLDALLDDPWRFPAVVAAAHAPLS